MEMSPGAARTLLIVEDDDTTRDAMKVLLELDGYCAVTAADGREALECLRGGLAPDLILLDLAMPHMDGFQFRDAQLQESRFAHIPVVIYSAHLDADESAVARLNVAGYVCKPFNIDRVRKLVAELCQPPTKPSTDG